MSLVIAIKDKDRIVLGADKQASAGGSKDHTNTKIWQVEDLPGAVMGSVGSARASQIIQYSPIIDKNLIRQNIETDYIICVVAPAIAACLKTHGITIEAAPGDMCPLMPNAFIFAYQDKAWMIWNDLSVSEIDEYLAIGSGADVARGALFATTDKNPFERIVTSIDAAATTTLYVDDGLDLLATKVLEEDGDQIAQALGFEITKPKKKKSSKVVDKNN
jgi:20S proteasome alpha/beta subunit